MLSNALRRASRLGATSNDSWRCAAVVAAAALGASAPAGAQVWHSWDGSPPGRAPTVALDLAQSDANASTWTITVHGFFLEPIVRNGVTFHRVTVPDPDFAEMFALTGLAAHLQDPDTLPTLPGDHEIGKPELPYHGSFIGIVTDGMPKIEIVDVVDPAPGGRPEPFVTLDQVGGIPLRCFPAQADPLDCFDDEPPFEMDDDFYKRSRGFFPSALVELGDVEGWASITGVRVYANLAQYDPSTFTLRLPKQLKIRIGHLGNILPFDLLPDISAELEKAYKRAVRNFEAIQGFFRALLGANYLVIVHRDFSAAINPFIAGKTAQGFTVGKVVAHANPVAGEIAATTPAIGAAIQASYLAARIARRSLAVVLVGDTDRIPAPQFNDPHPQIGVFSTDRPYACVWGFDQIPDIGIARFSPNNAGDLASQILKTLRYEDNAPAGNWCQRVLMTSHKQGDRVYLDNQCWGNRIVQLSPMGMAVYGPGAATAGWLCNTAGAMAGNNFVETDINAGVGVVAYRGHGLEDRWDGWSGLAQPTTSWRDVEVDHADIQNGCRNPVVFAICCLNGKFDGIDGIGEHWMSAGPAKAAVAHYGSVPPSRTQVNNGQNLWVFGNLYLIGYNDFGDLSVLLGRSMSTKYKLSGVYTTMAFNLLGDPRLKVRVTAAPNPPVAMCCMGDFDGNGFVDGSDLAVLLGSWGPCPGCPADINGDGLVNGNDLAIVLGSWGPC